MADFFNERHIDIMMVEAELVRIFDSLKLTQDVFVQLECGFGDGTVQDVGRTDICKNGNLRPQWNSRIPPWNDPSKSGRCTLRFVVQVAHNIRKEVVCGEAEFDLATLCNKAAGGPQELTIPLFKKDEQTGRLRFVFSLGDGPAPQQSSMSASSLGGSSTPSQLAAFSPTTKGRGWLGACSSVVPVTEPQPRRRGSDAGSGSQPGSEAATPAGQSKGCFGGTPVSEPEPQEKRPAPTQRTSPLPPSKEASDRENGDFQVVEQEAVPAGSPAGMTPSPSPQPDSSPPGSAVEASPNSYAAPSVPVLSEGAAARNAEFWDSFIERG